MDEKSGGAGFAVRTMMESKRVSVSEMARRFCVSERTVRRWMAGKSFPKSLSRRRSIARFCGLSEKAFEAIIRSGS